MLQAASSICELSAGLWRSLDRSSVRRELVGGVQAGCVAVLLCCTAPSAVVKPRGQNRRIKSLSGTRSLGFMRVRAAGQPRGAYWVERGRTAVNCNPNCNPAGLVITPWPSSASRPRPRRLAISQLTALLKTRLKRMQHRPGLLEGFLASTRLDLTPFCSPPPLRDR